MIEQRRAGFEAVCHARYVDLYQQIVREIGMDVGPIGSRRQAACPGEIWLQEIEVGSPQLVLHRLPVAILFVLFGEPAESGDVASPWIFSRRPEQRADPGKFQLPLSPRGRHAEQRLERISTPLRG